MRGFFRGALPTYGPALHHGLTYAQLMEVLAVVGMANVTNRIARGLRPPPADPQVQPTEG